jgi:hypothetical protein
MYPQQQELLSERLDLEAKEVMLGFSAMDVSSGEIGPAAH